MSNVSYIPVDNYPKILNWVVECIEKENEPNLLEDLKSIKHDSDTYDNMKNTLTRAGWGFGINETGKPFLTKED